MARRFTALVGLSTHTHLHARVHRECGFMQRYALRRMDGEEDHYETVRSLRKCETLQTLIYLHLVPPGGVSPVLEGVVHDGLQHQAVANVRRAAEMEHVYTPEGRVSVTQAAGL